MKITTMDLIVVLHGLAIREDDDDSKIESIVNHLNNYLDTGKLSEYSMAVVEVLDILEDTTDERMKLSIKKITNALNTLVG